MNKWILGGAMVIIVLVLIYNFTGGNDPELYREEIETTRKETDRFMRYSDDSPFHDAAIEYHGLHYFEPDQHYRITARFLPVKKRTIRLLNTNDGSKEEYLTYGYASFQLEERPQKLLILENVQDDKLFIPFGDATSAGETYGGGRYLDVEHNGGGTIVIDFNKAYNPYCAYGVEYTCPLPPKENLMEVPVRAGEKQLAMKNEK